MFDLPTFSRTRFARATALLLLLLACPWLFVATIVVAVMAIWNHTLVDLAVYLVASCAFLTGTCLLVLHAWRDKPVVNETVDPFNPRMRVN